MVADERLIDRVRDTFSLSIDRKNLIIIMVSIICYLIWLMAFPLFGPIMSNFLISLNAFNIQKGRILQIFLLTMTISSLSIGYLIDKTSKKTRFIYASALGTAILTFVFSFENNIASLVPLAAFLGIVAGVSPPAFGAFFADYTVPEERGRIMGVALAISMPIAYVFVALGSINVGGIKNAELYIIGTISLLSLVTLALKPKDKTVKHKTRTTIGASNKQKTLYAIPVTIFYIVAGIIHSVVFPTILENLRPDIFYVIWAFPLFCSSIIAGLLLDNWGRKTPMIIGLAITGISLGALGILGIRSSNITIIPLAVGYSIVTVSSLIIWADLAPAKSRGIHYGIGFSIIWFALLLGMIVSGSIYGPIIESQLKRFMFFSAIILFVSIPPLIIAKDALPKDIIEKKQMDRHLKQLLRMRAKEEARVE